MSSALEYPYGDTVQFEYAGLDLTLSEDKFLPTSDRVADTHMAMCGATFKVQEGTEIENEISTFGFGFSQGPEAGEFYTLDFNLWRLTDAEKGLLSAMRERQRISRRDPVRVNFRRIAFEYGSTTRNRAKVLPDPVGAPGLAGMSYFYPKFDVYLKFQQSDFVLMDRGCVSGVKRWQIRFTAEEYQLVPLSEDG